MYTVLQSTFLKALGWSILDSFWQMGMLWIVYLLITGNGKKLNANQRHNLAFLSLAAGALWFIASIYMNFGGEGKTFAFSAQSLGYVKLFTSAIEQSLPLISAIYLVVILSLIIRLYRQYRHTHRLATTQLSKADPEIRVFLAHLAAQMGIKKEIRVFLSGLVHTPLTIGFLKPVILLPVALVNNLTIKQTESLILHELYHIQRNDFVMNLLLVFADILLFFNPFAKFFKSAIQQEREHRCDDIVVQFRYDPADYAKALLIVEQQRANTAAIFMAATGAKKLLLLARVKRLLTGETLAAPVLVP
ncbi:MAG: M56 family metallopeptidase, partial [Chitinophagaceae bacterium]